MSKPGTLASRILNAVSRTGFQNDSVADRLSQIQYLLDRPYSCKFCGVPVSVPQEDQVKPANYCSHD